MLPWHSPAALAVRAGADKDLGWMKKEGEMEVSTTEGIMNDEAPQCSHHWVIESPQGATSMGRCKICGEMREFRNSAGDTLWEGDPMASISKMGGSRASRPVVAEVSPSLKED